MKLSDFRSKFNFKALSFVLGDAGLRVRHRIGKEPSWMAPISHGHHVVEYQPSVSSYYDGESGALDLDTVLVQREQIGHLDLWLFGVFNDGVGTGISGYLQSHLFDKKPKEVMNKCKETMRKACLSVRGKCSEASKEHDDKVNVGSASVLVINGERIVIASMGEYRAVVCRDGVAREVRASSHRLERKRHWPHKFIFGALQMPKVRIQARSSSIKYRITKSWRSSDIAVASQRVDSETEFVILGSPGVWEVMNNQEAVNLIGHIEDAQKAAECLTREAMTRRSRRNISCLVIRFD